MKRRARAVFTVEASWIFGISIMVIYMMIALSFSLYSETTGYVEATTAQEKDYVRIFRLVQMGEEILDK